MIRNLSQVDRVAISELCELAQMTSDGNDAARTIGVLAAERAALIIRGAAPRYEWSQGKIQSFADLWNVDERATFNGG